MRQRGSADSSNHKRRKHAIVVMIPVHLSHQLLTRVLPCARSREWEGMRRNKAGTWPGIYYSLLGERGMDRGEHDGENWDKCKRTTIKNNDNKEKKSKWKKIKNIIFN